MDNNLNYGVVGNCRTAALVSARGTIEWMCLPDFDSPSVFASLLDRRKGGCFGFDVAEEYRISQAYIPHTNILATTFSAAEGEFVILDFMPCYRSAQGRTLHASRTLPLRPVGQGKAAPAGTLRPCARLCPRSHGADRHARIHRKPQPLRPEEPALSLCLAAARKDRTAGGDRPRTRRILPAVAQRKSDSGGHRTRKTRILPHAGLLAQLDEPHEKIHLLQRRDRTEPC